MSTRPGRGSRLLVKTRSRDAPNSENSADCDDCSLPVSNRENFSRLSRQPDLAPKKEPNRAALIKSVMYTNSIDSVLQGYVEMRTEFPRKFRARNIEARMLHFRFKCSLLPLLLHQWLSFTKTYYSRKVNLVFNSLLVTACQEKNAEKFWFNLNLSIPDLWSHNHDQHSWTVLYIWLACSQYIWSF